MLGEKRLCKIHQIGNDFVVPVRPEGGELKAVAGLFGFIASLALLFDVAAAGGVGIEASWTNRQLTSAILLKRFVGC